MKIKLLSAAASAVVLFVVAPASAQEAPATATTAAAATTADAALPCELHVWPTHNYLGMNSGLLSGFGALGAVADMAAHKDRVATVKDLMRDYLGPDIQMAELNKLGIAETLKLKGYRIIVE